mgnify:CR=1 FL=1|jgi:hypothetical protein
MNPLNLDSASLSNASQPTAQAAPLIHTRHNSQTSEEIQKYNLLDYNKALFTLSFVVGNQLRKYIEEFE